MRAVRTMLNFGSVFGARKALTEIITEASGVKTTSTHEAPPLKRVAPCPHTWVWSYSDLRHGRPVEVYKCARLCGAREVRPPIPTKNIYTSDL